MTPFGLSFTANELDGRAIPAMLLLGPRGAGAATFRVNVGWGAVQPRQAGPFAFAGYDALVDAIRAEGGSVLGLLAYGAPWASTAPANVSGNARSKYPPLLGPWLDYVEATVRHFAGRITDWECWNEPDLSAFWHGTPGEYARLLAFTSDQIKTVDPNASVLFGGLAMADARSTFFRSVLTTTTYGRTADFFDVANLHSYGTMADFDRRWAKVRDELARVGVTGRPTWVTETGASSSPDPLAQAAWLRAALPHKRAAGAEKVLVFTLWDDARAGAQYAHHGLLDGNLAPKPARDAYAAVAGSVGVRA